MSIKNTLDKRQTPFAFPLQGRSYGSRSSSASFTYFHYTKQNFGVPTNTLGTTFSNSEMLKVEQGYVDDEISNVKISKSITQASGTFSISLLPSKNWKQILSPGDWIIIYFQEDFRDKNRYKDKPNNKNMMMLGNIDRISRSLEKDQDDKVTLRYVVSGRGFGKVFEETDVWFNPYAFQKENLNRVLLADKGLELTGNPSDLTNTLLKIFLGKGADLPTGRVDGINNWMIPSALAKVFTSSGSLTDTSSENSKFYDILKNKIQHNLPGYKVREMLTLNSNGSLHDMMKRTSNQLVNELYYEETRTNDDKIELSIILRPRTINTPFLETHLEKDQDRKTIMSMINGNYKTLQAWSDENFVEICNAEILYEDMGKDDHSRMNMFWLKPVTGLENVIAYAANFQNKNSLANPTYQSNSIQRCGLKRFDQVLEFCYSSNGGDGTSQPEIIQWKMFMLQLYDMHYANHLYEAGTIECTGVLEAELGKALIILPVTSDQKKVYLIEGYEHNWSFPGKWTTKFTLTHGQFKTNDSNIYIDVAGAGDFGAKDKEIDSIYLAKTESSR